MNKNAKFKKEMSAVKEKILDIIDKHNYGSLYFTLVPSDNDLRLLDEYAEQIKAWRDFNQNVVSQDESIWEESNFHDVCRGFMAAKGVNTEDAHYIATFCRYNLQDFT